MAELTYRKQKSDKQVAIESIFNNAHRPLRSLSHHLVKFTNHKPKLMPMITKKKRNFAVR